MPTTLPPFDFDLLRTFVAIVDSGSFTAAAHRIGRTQSTVSLQMRRLEDGLGRPLFERQGDSKRSRMSLTPDGDLLLTDARRILRLGDEVRAKLMEPEVGGVVRLGAPEDFATSLLPDILARFARAHPQVQLEVTCDFTVHLLDGYARGLYDLVLFKRERQNLAGGGGIGVWQETLVWAASERLLVGLDSQPLPLVLAPAPDLYRKAAIAALEQAGHRFRIVYSCPSLAGLQAVVRAGLGITVLPRGMVPTDLMVLSCDEHNLPPLPDSEIVLYKAAGQLSPASILLSEHIVHSLEQSGNKDPVLGAV
jgi:DNA-binding transcriptional LysR family regulator